MPDIEVTSTSEEGYSVSSVVEDWELTIDATGEEGPTSNMVLAADYAACFIPALRVAANKAGGYEDIGRVDIDVGADLDEDDDLESIEFEISVEEALGNEVQDIIESAEDICHIHSVIVEDLHADITVEDEAF